MLAKKCAHCSTPFHSSRSDAAFCSKACRNAFDYWLRSRHPGHGRSIALIELYITHRTYQAQQEGRRVA